MIIGQITKNKRILFPIALIVAFLVLLVTFPSANAAIGVGASPGIIYFNKMLRNGYAEGFVTVSVGTDEFVSVTATPNGVIAEWLEFPEGPHYMINKDNPKRVKIIVKPPADVANGVYNGYIRFTTSPLGTIESGAGSSIQVSVDVAVTIEITDLQFLKCKASSIQIKDTEQGQPILISMNVLNQGNVRTTPSVDVTIWNSRQDKIVKTINNFGSANEILPTTNEQVFLNLPSSSLGIAQYWASISVNPCGDSQFLTFDVVEPGSLGLDGILKTIITKVWADVGEVVPITAVFQNVGESPVKARFEGNVQLEGRVLELLKSNEVIVNVGEEVNLTTFFTPKEPGRYIVRGRVFYAGKQTYENTGIINVKGIRINYPLIILYSLIAVLLIYIIYKIYQRKIKGY